MKLLECYIENFGKLSHFSYAFRDGMNVLCHDNGWGKTTFGAFLKAMLYGLPASRSKNLFENERARYQPWQGGRFGGWLTFEVGGKVYCVERGFGAKESADTFLLVDAATNTPSKDFEGAVLGEVLFGIDVEGFERSTYISEKSDYVKADYSDVQAKLVNLRDFEDADKAIKRLGERKKFYRPTSTRGEIVDLTNEQYRLQEELAKAEKATKEYDRLSHTVAEWDNKQKALLEENDRLRLALDRIAQGRLLQAYEQHTKELKATLKEAELAQETAEATPLPTLEEMAEVTRAVRSMESQRAVLPETPVKAKEKPSSLPLLLGILGVLLLGLVLVHPALVLVSLAVIGISIFLHLKGKTAPKNEAETPKEEARDTTEEEGVLADFLAKYPILDTPHPSGDAVLLHVSRLMEKRDQLVGLREKAKQARLALEQYEKAHPLPPERDRLPSEAEERELRGRMEDCARELHEAVERLQELQRETAVYATMAQALPDIRQKLADVTSALDTAQENYKVVMATIAYLEEAKKQLTAGYLDGVQEKFARYVGQMSQIDAELASATYKLTPSFEVTVCDAGASHAQAAVSRGTRDLLALCLQLALRDAIFDKEEPPLFLDDPFIAFDPAHIESALQCLKELGQTKQIIYFTCHSSRV